MNYKMAVPPPPPKKTVVVDLEYMRPSVSRSRSRSRSISRSRSRSRTGRLEEEYNDLNIDELLNRQYTNGNGVSDDVDDYGSDTRSSSDYDSDSDSESDSDSDSRIDSDYIGGGASADPASSRSRTHHSVQETDYAVNSDDDLLQSVLDEPTFPLDVNEILNAMNKSENNTIANLTLKKIADRRREILSSLNLPTDKMEDFDRRLQMYRVIEDPRDLKHTQLLRWIPLRSLETKPYLTIGGTLFSIKVRPDDGLHQITIRNVKRFVFQIKFELNVVFQRLSREELLILRAVEYVEDV